MRVNFVDEKVISKLKKKLRHCKTNNFLVSFRILNKIKYGGTNNLYYIIKYSKLNIFNTKVFCH